MTKNEIKELQREYDVLEYQEVIHSGSAWIIEGIHGRIAMEYLKSGVCYLPLKSYSDYWGNVVPSRSEIEKNGGVGTLEHSKSFWSDKKRVREYFRFKAQLQAESNSEITPLPTIIPENTIKIKK